MSDETITIDLNAPVPLADVPALLRRVFDWWIKELLGLAPAWFKRRLPAAPVAAALHAGAKTWRIVSNGGVARAIELDPAVSDKEIADRILEAAPDFSLSRLTVLLPPSGVLQRRVTLPIMPDANLRAAIELQIDRLSPFAADAVRFDARIATRDAVEGTMQVNVVAAPRATVEALEQRLTALGLKPAAIDIETANGDRAGFDLKARTEQTGSRRALLTTAAYVGAAALAWYGAVYAWGAARDREIESWQATVTALRPAATRSAALRREVEGLIEPLQMARTHTAGRALDPLLEVTRLLPETTRLSEFRLNGDTIELTGLGTDPPSLIGKLEASKLFKDVKFRSPVTRRPELGKDRFEISMKLERGAAP